MAREHQPRLRRPFLAPFPTLAAIMALSYLLGDESRTSSPSFDPAKAIAPMHVWGVVFLVGVAVLAAALIAGNPRTVATGLFAGGAIYTWWSACFALAALVDPQASLTGWAVYATIAYAHYYAAWRIWTRQ